MISFVKKFYYAAPIVLLLAVAILLSVTELLQKVLKNDKELIENQKYSEDANKYRDKDIIDPGVLISNVLKISVAKVFGENLLIQFPYTLIGFYVMMITNIIELTLSAQLLVGSVGIIVVLLLLNVAYIVLHPLICKKYKCFWNFVLFIGAICLQWMLYVLKNVQ